MSKMIRPYYCISLLSNIWTPDITQLDNSTRWESQSTHIEEYRCIMCWGTKQVSLLETANPIKQGHFFWKNYYFYSLFTFPLQSTVLISLSLKFPTWLLLSFVVRDMALLVNTYTCHLKRTGLIQLEEDSIGFRCIWE